MLTEESVIDQITVDEFGNVNVRRSDRVLRDGVVIAQTYHRHVVAVDAVLTTQDARVAAIAVEGRKGARTDTRPAVR